VVSRGGVHRYRVSESFLPELAGSLVRTGSSAMSADTFGMGRDCSRGDGYCVDGALDALVRRLHLIADPRGNATIRVTNVFEIDLAGRSDMSLAVGAPRLAMSDE